jgi:hypothetical protein
MRYIGILILMLAVGPAEAQLRWARSGPGGGGAGPTGCANPSTGGVLDGSTGCIFPKLGMP